MQKITRFLLGAAAATLLVAAPHAQTTAVQSRTRTHVETLASDKFEGRLTGSPGEKLAADYIISELKRMGAQPLPGFKDFRLPFTFTAGPKDGRPTPRDPWGETPGYGTGRINTAYQAGGPALAPVHGAAAAVWRGPRGSAIPCGDDPKREEGP